MRRGDLIHLALQIALLGLLLGATWASAQGAPAPRCAPWPEWEAILAERWGEAPAWVGLAPDGRQMMLTRAADGTTWTLLVLGPGGACLIADGIAWAAIEPPIPGQES
jgi:hypothetical protein